MTRFRETSVPESKNFYKRNYVKATEIITPKFYLEEDFNTSGEGLSIIDELINTHVNIARFYSNVITSSIGGINPVVGSTQYSSINTFSGLGQFFIKQNRLTDLDYQEFESKILRKVGKNRLGDFNTSAEFREYLLNDLLPATRLNNPSGPFLGITQTSALHEYLITNLNWLYFLNISGASYDGSTIVADILTNNLYNEKRSVLLNDALKGVTEYIFRNFLSNLNTWVYLGLLPTDYLPGLALPDTTYTSGLQQLDKLKTLIDIVYSPNYADRTDEKVAEIFDNFLNLGMYSKEKERKGPFSRLLKSMSYGFADYSNSVDTLSILSDIKRCPDEYIPELANLLGWKLIGPDPLKWRMQLINAVTIYKAAGTKRSLQYVVDSIFQRNSLDVSSRIIEMWESYIPHLIYYSLATESVLLKDFDTWTENFATEYKVDYIPSSLDESVRCVTDEIMLRTAKKFKLNFWYHGEEISIDDPKLMFNYRGRDIKVPPFEEYQYYISQKLNVDIVYYLVDQLVCFGVPRSFAEQVGTYLIDNSIKSIDDISLGYSWLVFTSSVNYPPNWNDLILDISNKKVEYLPLWSGKSSHFKIIFENSDFEFTNEELNLYSKDGLQAFSELIDQFVPAHAVKQLFVKSSDSDTYTNDSTDLTMIWMNKADPQFSNGSDSNSLNNYESSGTSLNFYKRGGTGSYNIVSRTSVDSITDSLMQVSAIAAPRKSFRRRNYRSLLNTHGFYDRAGHNMPTTTESYVVEDSLSSLGFLPLGLIPSSQQYVPIPDYRNIPAIYGICENLNSTSIYSGLTVSNTFPCRGIRGQYETIPAPDDSIDVYLWLGDSLATGDVVTNSLSAMNTYYSEIKNNVSGTYLFIPSSANFQLIQPGKNSDVLQVSTGGLASAIGGDWTFGYELYKKNNRNSYIIKLGLPNSYYTSAAGGNYTASNSPQFNYSTSINDWAVESNGEILSVYKNWITSAINNLGNIYGDKVTYRGAISFMGTNVSQGILTAEELTEFGVLGTAPKFVSRVVSSINNIKQNVESHIRSLGIYKGSPIWIMSYPDSRYNSIPVFGTAYYTLFRNSLGSLSSLNSNLYFYDPPSYLTIINEPDTFFDVHYDGSSNLFLGSSLANYFFNTKLQASRLDLDAVDYSIDRGQLDAIMTIMFQLGESAKLTLASAIIETNLKDYINYLPWKNVVQSIANQLTYQDIGFPSNFKDYTNFKFGKNIHKLYKTYCEDFQRYKLNKRSLTLDGNNFFAHCYGSLLRNSDLFLPGSAFDSTTSSLLRVRRLLPGGEYFPSGGGGVHNASSLQASSFKYAREEVTNSNILDGINLIHTIGGGSRNYFSIFNLDRTTFKNYSERRSNFVVENNLLKLSSKNESSLPRIRFDIKSQVHPVQEGNPEITNFLSPDHEFEFSLSAMLAAEEFNSFGNGTVGVLIHTSFENSGTWVFIPTNSPCEFPKDKCCIRKGCKPLVTDGYWQFVEASSLTLDNIKNCYSHKLQFNLKDYSISSELCYKDDSVLYNLNASDFSINSVNFHTVNKAIRVPESYYKVYNQVHRKNQNYFIEVFLYPNQSRDLYISRFNLVDKSLNEMCKYIVSATGNPYPVNDFNCKEYSFKLSKEQLYHIFKYFTEITGSQSTLGKASRIASVTQNLFETSGGSRLNYRISPAWATNTLWNNLPSVGLLSSLQISN